MSGFGGGEREAEERELRRHLRYEGEGDRLALRELVDAVGSELTRLRAELEAAKRERDEARERLGLWEARAQVMEAECDAAERERDKRHEREFSRLQTDDGPRVGDVYTIEGEPHTLIGVAPGDGYVLMRSRLGPWIATSNEVAGWRLVRRGEGER